MLICEVPGHDEEDIIGLCFNKNCSSRPEFCFKCRTQIHIKHDKDALRFKDIQKLIYETQYTFGEQKKVIDKCLEQIKECIQEYLRTHFQQWIDECSKLEEFIKTQQHKEIKNRFMNYQYYIKFNKESLRQQIQNIEQISKQFLESFQQIQTQEMDQGAESIYIQESVLNQESNLNLNNKRQESQILVDSEIQENNSNNNQNQLHFNLLQVNDDKAFQLQLDCIREQENMESIQLTEKAKLQSNHNLKDALQTVEQAITKDQNNAEAQLVKGQILYKQEKFDESLSCFKRCQQLNPENKDVYPHIAYALSRQNKLVEADKAYEEAIKFNPQISQLYSNKAGVLNNLQRYNDAINLCDSALNLDKFNASAYNNKGYSLTYLNRLDEALKNLDLATQHGQDNPDFWANKGNLLLKRNEFSKAKICLDKVEILGCKTPNCFRFKSQMLFQQGRTQDALDVCNQGLQFYPHDYQLKELRRMF